MSDTLDNDLAAELEIARSIPRYPQLQPPLIKYDMIHNLKCIRYDRVSLPLVKQVQGEKRVDLLKTNKLMTSRKPIGNIGDVGDEENIKYLWNSPRMMIVFAGGDINCAIHYIVESLHNPFEENAVATLLLQECLLKEFKERLADRFHELPPEIANHPLYLRTIQKLKDFKASTITGKNVTTPILVCDFSHNYLGEGPTGAMTLHTFRTPKDSTEVYLKEPMKFSSVCIFDENLGSAYEIVARITTAQIFLINCYDVDLDPIKSAFINDCNMVKVSKGYHYESVTFREMRKVIVFPMGNVFTHRFY